MRDYAKISPQFWIGNTGKKLREAGAEATIVALYLLSNPHANMIGFYYLPKLYIAHETSLGMEGASKGLQRAIEAGFCGYDDASEVVFVYEMARYQGKSFGADVRSQAPTSGTQRPNSDTPTLLTGSLTLGITPSGSELQKRLGIM